MAGNFWDPIQRQMVFPSIDVDNLEIDNVPFNPSGEIVNGAQTIAGVLETGDDCEGKDISNAGSITLNNYLNLGNSIANSSSIHLNYGDGTNSGDNYQIVAAQAGDAFYVQRYGTSSDGLLGNLIIGSGSGDITLSYSGVANVSNGSTSGRIYDSVFNKPSLGAVLQNSNNAMGYSVANAGAVSLISGNSTLVTLTASNAGELLINGNAAGSGGGGGGSQSISSVLSTGNNAGFQMIKNLSSVQINGSANAAAVTIIPATDGSKLRYMNASAIAGTLFDDTINPPSLALLAKTSGDFANQSLSNIASISVANLTVTNINGEPYAPSGDDPTLASLAASNGSFGNANLSNIGTLTAANLTITNINGEPYVGTVTGIGRVLQTSNDALGYGISNAASVQLIQSGNTITLSTDGTKLKVANRTLVGNVFDDAIYTPSLASIAAKFGGDFGGADLSNLTINGLNPSGSQDIASVLTVGTNAQRKQISNLASVVLSTASSGSITLQSTADGTNLMVINKNGDEATMYSSLNKPSLADIAGSTANFNGAALTNVASINNLPINSMNVLTGYVPAGTSSDYQFVAGAQNIPVLWFAGNTVSGSNTFTTVAAESTGTIDLAYTFDYGQSNFYFVNNNAVGATTWYRVDGFVCMMCNETSPADMVIFASSISDTSTRFFNTLVKSSGNSYPTYIPFSFTCGLPHLGTLNLYAYIFSTQGGQIGPEFGRRITITQLN